MLVSDEHPWFLHTWFGREGLKYSGKGQRDGGCGEGRWEDRFRSRMAQTGQPSWKMGKRHRSRHVASESRVRGLEDAIPVVGFHLAKGERLSAAKQSRSSGDMIRIIVWQVAGAS